MLLNTPCIQLLAQFEEDSRSSGAAGGVFGMVFMCCFAIIELGLAVLIIAGMWKVFVKAGQPGWAAIIPIYNLIVMLQIVGRPIWWIIWFLIPCMNFITAPIFGTILGIDMAKSFGKSVGFGVGLAWLGMIFYPMLGFGKDTYLGPSVKQY